MIEEKDIVPINVLSDDWSRTKCDKYDYMIATFCGVTAGLIDIFFVSDPLTSVLGKNVDKVAEGLTKKAAQFFWINDQRTTGKSKKMPQTLEQCISYLEQAFPVNYDARYAKDLIVKEGVLSGMRPVNHHLLSLSHSPDPIGLIFSIINQFMGYATFIDNGTLVHVVPKKTSGAIPYLQGNNLPSMLFCGFVNWIGHLLSDLVGSSSTRKAGKTGRGMGIPIPFYELFLLCDFGDFDGKTFAEMMISVFEQGYDLRFGATMAIPILIEELMIKSIWIIRQKFIRKKTWEESIPSHKYADLRIMLIVGNSTLCLVDGVDAVVHGVAEGNVISFICHLNLIGWVRLVLLVLKELRLRFGPILDKVINQFLDDVLSEVRLPGERERIQQFFIRLQKHDQQLAEVLSEFVGNIEKEYRELYIEINATFDMNNSSKVIAEHSVRLAEISGVGEEKIVRSRKQLDDLFG